MKARITTVFATAVVALAVAGGALAAPHQSTVKGWSTAPATVKPWAVKTWSIKAWSIKAWSVRPNPTCIRSRVTPNPMSLRGLKGW